MVGCILQKEQDKCKIILMLILFILTSISYWHFVVPFLDPLQPCVGAPTALTIDQSSSIVVNGLTVKNGQQMHFTISRSESVRIINVVVSAPGDSPNTDGIHLTSSKNVVIENTKIGTGDDCVSIVSGCSNIKMKGIYCGPGHGISIGSLGNNNSTGFVSAVVLDTAFLKGTTNGLRIKTYQGGSGYVRAVRYANIQMVDVANPIIIDQFYCDSPKSCPNQTSAVEISQIMYQNISGTSKSPKAIKFSTFHAVTQFPAITLFLITSI